MNEIEITQLWECPKCGWITDGRSLAHGPIVSQAYCQGLPVKHKRTKMDRITVVYADQMAAALLLLADELEFDCRRVGENKVRDLATSLG